MVYCSQRLFFFGVVLFKRVCTLAPLPGLTLTVWLLGTKPFADDSTTYRPGAVESREDEPLTSVIRFRACLVCSLVTVTVAPTIGTLSELSTRIVMLPGLCCAGVVTATQPSSIASVRKGPKNEANFTIRISTEDTLLRTNPSLACLLRVRLRTKRAVATLR